MADDKGRVSFARAFESLKSTNYRYFWIATVVQQAAMNMDMVARPWFMYTLTKSPAMLGLTSLASALPMIALSLFGGVIADRVPKKYVLLLAPAASSIVVLGIALAIHFEVITWMHLIVASVLKGIIFALMSPSRQAIVPELVGEERLMNAIALNTAGMNINRFLAPAITGVLIAFQPVGIGGVYFG